LTPKMLPSSRARLFGLLLVLGLAGLLVFLRVGSRDASATSSTGRAGPGRAGTVVSADLTQGPFVRNVRLHGLVEAVEFYSVIAPRLTGQQGTRLTVVRLAAKGTLVRKGDLLVEFDRQTPLRTALDKRAEWMDLEEQIRKKQADQAAQRAQEDTQLKTAEHDVALAKLEVLKNELLPRIEAEKNTLNLEGAEAKFTQLRATTTLKRKAAAADLAILQVRRDRAAVATKHAEHNAERMLIRSPIDGLVVLKAIWKGGQMGEAQEGEEMWPGTAFMDVVGPSAMRVRVKVNQADLAGLRVGLPASVMLDAYPGKRYPAKLTQVAPVGVSSQFSPKVRSFVVLFDVSGVDSQLTPDLSAAVDVELERIPKAVLAPREAVVWQDGRSYLRMKKGSSTELREVGLGPMNDSQVVIKSGVEAAAPARASAGDGSRGEASRGTQ
jgi:HlyD family secretion protein